MNHDLLVTYINLCLCYRSIIGYQSINTIRGVHLHNTLIYTGDYILNDYRQNNIYSDMDSSLKGTHATSSPMKGTHATSSHMKYFI
jgi:hypothetical protein